MSDAGEGRKAEVRRRAAGFVLVLLLVVLVGDGLPLMLADPLRLQVLLLPVTALFILLTAAFLGFWRVRLPAVVCGLASEAGLLWLGFVFELLFVALYVYETRHFAPFGYQMLRLPVFACFVVSIAAIGYVSVFAGRTSAGVKLLAVLAAYASAGVLAIFSFPLNYLRSDMLPVIYWADRALLAGGNPYQPFHVGERIYDFPYLPGMLLVFAPAQALHGDLRWAAICYLVLGMGLVFWATLPQHRSVVATLISLLVLNPYLQYRHELYTQGHFLSLIVVFVLLQRRRFAWSALAFGVSMVISQFSWVIFPFFLMFGLRRSGWKEVGRMALLAFVAAAALVSPFLVANASHIAHNSVGQWDTFGRAIARPMNLSFWASYVVPLSSLKWIQLFLLTVVFLFCWIQGRCQDLADMLRWMIAALTVFILLNVIVDGYFYLMLLLPMLVYTCVANEWWATPGDYASEAQTR